MPDLRRLPDLRAWRCGVRSAVVVSSVAHPADRPNPGLVAGLVLISRPALTVVALALLSGCATGGGCDGRAARIDATLASWRRVHGATLAATAIVCVQPATPSWCAYRQAASVASTLAMAGLEWAGNRARRAPCGSEEEADADVAGRLAAAAVAEQARAVGLPVPPPTFDPATADPAAWWE